MKQPENIEKYGIHLQAIRQALFVCLDGGFFDCCSKEDEVYNKAVVRLVLSNKLSAKLFMAGCYNFRFRNHKRDKNGKLISVEAYL